MFGAITVNFGAITRLFIPLHAAQLLLLLFSVTLCASAQAADPTAATATAAASEPAALAPLPKRSTFQVIAATAAHVQQLRQGGLVVYMRHGPSDAHRPDQLPLQLDNCDSQRPLSEAGRALLKTIGRNFAKLQLPYAELIISPFCRVQESAQLVFNRPGTIDPALRYTAAMPDAESNPPCSARATGFRCRWPTPGTTAWSLRMAPTLPNSWTTSARGRRAPVRPLGTQHPVGFEYLASIEPHHWPALLRQLAPL